MAYPISRYTWVPLLYKRITRIEGIEHTVEHGPVLYVANHVGHFDPMLLITALVKAGKWRKVYSIASWPLLWIPGFRQWLAIIPLKKFGGGTTKIIKKKLLEGEAVLIYPEGRVNASNIITNVHTGVARLALNAGVKVVPIGIKRKTSTPKTFFGRFFELFYETMEIFIGKSIDLSRWDDRPMTQEIVWEVTDEIMKQVALLSGKKYARLA